MAGTRILAPLLHAVDRAQGKLLLVGDPAQLPAVGAGGLYQALCERLGPLELNGNQRQRDPLEREALAHLRTGDPEPYLAYAARHGRLAIDEDAAAAKERLLDDWWREAHRSPTRNVMLAYDRADVDELNQAAHALMLRHRRLDGEAVTLAEREYRVGDQVLCRRNDGGLGLRNGMRGTIVDLDGSGFVVRDLARVHRHVPFTYAAEHLDYGYALTGHAAQGMTLDRAFVLLPDQGSLQEWGYVVCTRARLKTRLYLAACDLRERETPLFEPNPGTPAERTARALQQSAAESLAVDRGRRGDTTINLLNQEQQKLERHSRSAAHQLAAAERERRQLRPWNRCRRGELEAEIALRKHTVVRAEEKAEQLRRRVAERRQALSRADERHELTTDVPVELGRPGRTVKLDREPRSLGLDL